MSAPDPNVVQSLRARIRDVPDFPKPGILFRDVTPLLADHAAYDLAITSLLTVVGDLAFDVVAGPEARGFLFGAPLALRHGAGFVPIRKRGKLPWHTREATYALEYGVDAVQAHEDAFVEGARVLLVDDLLATGGTMSACRRLVEDSGAIVVATAFLIELDFLNGREALAGLDVRSIVRY